MQQAATGSALDAWLDFIAAMTASLAWPIAAVVIALIFRGQIAALLSGLKRLTWGDKVADFSDKLDATEAVAVAVESKEPADAPDPDAGVDEVWDATFEKLVALAPGAAVLEAWKPIENRLIDIDQEMHSGEPPRPTGAVISALRKRNLISPEAFQLLFNLWQLRNSAAHAQAVSATDAFRFRDAARAVRGTLASVKIPKGRETPGPS